MEPGDFTQLSPVNTSASAVLVGDYAAYWLDTLPSRLKPRTVKSYRELYRLHLAPSLNGIGLGELKRAQVKALLLDKQRQGLSRNTVRLIGSCLSALCSEAIDDGLLTVSPVAALGRWLRGSAGEQCDAIGRARTIRPFTSREVASILATARKFYPRYYPLFLTLARTGCRPGEALALRQRSNLLRCDRWSAFRLLAISRSPVRLQRVAPIAIRTGSESPMRSLSYPLVSL